MRAPGLIIAAPASGSGKTLVTLGLVRHLRDRGLRVAAFKAGPDYIDPTFHAAAGDGQCANLDLWAMRPAALAGLVGARDGDADIAVCEGVMGLFDGTGPSGDEGSTAALAIVTGWPVVLVVDVRRQGTSAVALVGGFARHDPAVTLAGVIFNRVAGQRHRALLEAAMTRHLPEIPCLGVLPRDQRLALPERHLGLVPAEESGAAPVIERAAEAIAEGVDIERLLARARRSGLAVPGPVTPLPPLGQRIAVARDEAFLFAYEAVLRGWQCAGAQLSFFAPLADEPPDPAADAVYLPGGYPELHAGRLAAAEHFTAGLRRAAANGAAVYGECGGYMALGEALTDAAGNTHRMAGLLPLATSFAERRLQLGYREATTLGAGPLGATGVRFRGHEFHYATTVFAEGERLFALRDAAGHDLGRSGLRRGRVMGSFIHLIDRAD
jgi:cobyrinic acid a,c-diamide synthase